MVRKTGQFSGLARPLQRTGKHTALAESFGESFAQAPSGIRCLLRNQYLAGALGELPVNECWPQVWVVDAADAPRAARLIEAALPREAPPGEAWTCPACDERLEAQFAQCWRCGALRVRMRAVKAAILGFRVNDE